MATTIPMAWCLILAAALFFLGMGALLVRRNALTVFMGIELMLNSANLTFLTFARERGDHIGHLSAFFVISVAAAEAAVGLAVIIGMFRSRGTINVDEVHSMRH